MYERKPNSSKRFKASSSQRQKETVPVVQYSYGVVVEGVSQKANFSSQGQDVDGDAMTCPSHLNHSQTFQNNVRGVGHWYEWQIKMIVILRGVVKISQPERGMTLSSAEARYLCLLP